MYEYFKTLDGYVGDARVYVRSETALNGILISRARTFDRGDETMIFPYDLIADEVSDWGELYAGYGEDHATALRNYEDSL